MRLMRFELTLLRIKSPLFYQLNYRRLILDNLFSMLSFLHGFIPFLFYFFITDGRIWTDNI